MILEPFASNFVRKIGKLRFVVMLTLSYVDRYLNLSVKLIIVILGYMAVRSMNRPYFYHFSHCVNFVSQTLVFKCCQYYPF